MPSLHPRLTEQRIGGTELQKHGKGFCLEGCLVVLQTFALLKKGGIFGRRWSSPLGDFFRCSVANLAGRFLRRARFQRIPRKSPYPPVAKIGWITLFHSDMSCSFTQVSRHIWRLSSFEALDVFRDFLFKISLPLYPVGLIESMGMVCLTHFPTTVAIFDRTHVGEYSIHDGS